MKHVGEEELARVLRKFEGTRPFVVASGNFATPRLLTTALEANLAEYRLFVLNGQGPFPDREGVTLETVFVGPGMRGLPRLRYLPMRLSLVPAFLASACPADVVLVQTAPPAGGKVSLGVEVNVLPRAIEGARAHGGIVVAQVNPRMPYTFGDGEIDEDGFDYAIDCEAPLASPPPFEGDDTTRAIGERVATLVEDGSTLQIGIGAVPDATLCELEGRRGLGVWSEMVSDGILRLERAGALDRDRPIVASFLFGSPELYAWAHCNDRLVLRRTETTNDPVGISANRAMLSVNSALQVDLFAQANASFIRGTVYSGFGGQPDFTVGALHSPGGHAVIALPSWHPRADASSIVPLLEGPVTSFQHSAIITEQGSAFLYGRSHREQASAIIEDAAHPSVRDSLRQAAGRLGA